MSEKKLKTNYHMHTTFCDGKNSAEEMVKAAIEKGFDIIGFSSHSMYPFASTWHVAPREHKNYSAEIKRLAEVYKDQIQIYCGFEADYISGICSPSMEEYNTLGAQFLVGSVHYVPGTGGYIEADGNPANVRQGIDEYFHGNIQEAVGAYFSCEREMLEKGDFTFLGHPDVIRKQNGFRIPFGALFDENAEWYKRELKTTAKAIAKSGRCVEINTGGMARGYMETPFPSPAFLEILHDHGVPITINSDAHKTEHLDFWFEEAKEYARKAGYTQSMYFADGSLTYQEL